MSNNTTGTAAQKPPFLYKDILTKREVRKKFLKTYSSMVETKVCDCEKNFPDYYNNYLNLMQTNYKLKPGVFWVSQLGMHVSNANLTDSIAEKMLSLNKGWAKYFTDMPAPPEISYEEKLKTVKGIGKATAKKIVANYPTPELLLDAISRGEDFGVESHLIIEALG